MHVAIEVQVYSKDRLKEEGCQDNSTNIGKVAKEEEIFASGLLALMSGILVFHQQSKQTIFIY